MYVMDRTAPRRPARLLVAALAVLAVAGGLEVAGQSAGGTDREADLAELRERIEETRRELEIARGREQTLADRLAAVELELTLESRRLAEAVTAREVAAERVERARAGVEDATAALAEARQDLSRRIGGLYRLGARGHLRLVLAAEPGADLSRAVRLLRYLVRRDTRAVERFRTRRESLDRRRERLAAELDDLSLWVEAARERRGELARVRERQATLLAQAATERRDLDLRNQALEDKEQKLATLLDSLYGRSAEPLSGQPIGQFQGVLDWPLDGSVSQGFGRRRDPRYRTEVPHRGLEIVPTPEGDATVRAVYPGEVLYAAPFEGYGPTVVLHHAGRVFTLYAGLEGLRVSQGDMVDLATVLGRAPGPVYFEIRRHNQPEDPSGWLR